MFPVCLSVHQRGVPPSPVGGGRAGPVSWSCQGGRGYPLVLSGVPPGQGMRYPTGRTGIIHYSEGTAKESDICDKFQGFLTGVLQWASMRIFFLMSLSRGCS